MSDSVYDMPVKTGIDRLKQWARGLDTSDAFILTAEEMAQALADQCLAFRGRGYHTWDYWRNTTEGLAALGESVFDYLIDSNPELFRTIETQVLADMAEAIE